MGEETTGADFDGTERAVIVYKKFQEDIVELFVFFSKDDVAQSLMGQGRGFTNFSFAIGTGGAVGFDAEGDGPFVNSDADFGIAASGGEIAEEFFRLGLSESEAVEAMADD